MIHVIDLAKKVQAYLHEKDFPDFKIFIRINFSIDVFVFSDHAISAQSIKNDFLKEITEDNNSEDNFYRIEKDCLNLSFRVIPSDEKNDPFYSNIINFDENIIIGPRYRLDSLLNNEAKGIELSTKEIPIITFYSYKGGMGRTTTMVSYAMDLAINQNKKVVVIDCDLEAPGYLNFFDLSANQELIKGKKNGLVEFISDSQMLTNEGKEKLELSDYIINVGDSAKVDDSAFENLKNIWLIPAGNLNMDYEGNGDESNLYDYLEGLSKINLSNTEIVVNCFKLLFKKIKEAYNPDVILLDSRTGFNDIFGTAAFYLSSCVVGFFGFSRQTQPGLINLVNKYYSKDNTFKMILVFSILPTEHDSQKLEDKLYSEVNKMINRKGTDETDEDKKDFPMLFSLHRNHSLEQIGIGEKPNDDAFIKLVKERNFEDFSRIFQYINELCFPDLSQKIEDENLKKEEKNDELAFVDSPNFDYIYKTPSIILRNVILRHLKSVFSNIKLFAEDTKIEEKHFFYRKCMQDFF